MMAAEKPRIAIVGLGLIGGSIGLALREAAVASAVVGHDKEPGVNNKAKKLGVVDKAEWNLINATEEADLIILAVPAGEIKATLEAISPYLRAGCVIMDTASLKVPVLAMAEETLPEHVHFVGGDPIISAAEDGQQGVEAARADLFKKGLFCLTPSPSADPAAVKLVSDLAMILGSKPVFFDPAEHDGLLAAVDHLPVVLSLALLDMVIHQPTWRELRKVAGASFEVGTQLASSEPPGFGDLCLSNRENILRWIDAYAASLALIRQTLEDGDAEALNQRFEVAAVERAKWLHDRSEGKWEGDKGVEMPEKPNLLADAFLGGLWRKRSKKDD
jgi:prephenate dehydrogenase